jgi:hypothetical protein
MSDQQPAPKRPVGRPSKQWLAEQARLNAQTAQASDQGPKKAAGVEREPIKSTRWKMRAAPNWEVVDTAAEDTPDRLRIEKHEIPEGMSLVWVTDSVLGQGVPQHRAEFEKRGWTPVHQDDFDGQFNGKFMARDKTGEINLEGMVLMARPEEITKAAKLRDQRKAVEQVKLKEQALTAGDLSNVSLDARHPSAIGSNRISKSLERISVPKE